MAGDYTRFTFDPAKDYSGVWKQQGRVDLDADWNEYVEISDRRWRVETVDIIGRAVYPKNITPDAFLIHPTGPGTFDIGIGRLYVDGLMAENRGLPPHQYDATFGETVGTTRVPYSNQPYFPAPLPPALPGTPNTTDLIYLDVWQRELTYVEDPEIQEIALGGPDTATRLQTVWQVRALPNTGANECGARLPAWDALTAPSGARLTTAAVAPPASDDPCIIAPSGGFRGLDNRLYRVEIHATGTIGGANPPKFKWSRDNASIATAVDAIDGTRAQLTVRRIGRDAVLRFQVGDWVEVLDDHVEFRQEAGHLAKVTAVDEANRILTLAPPLPAGFSFDPTKPERHSRIRRWDQKTGVDANGLLDVTAAPIELEDGVQVTFSGSNYKVGDYWVFAARTADGSVEKLTAAPPRGILHHYARLGFLSWGATPTTTVFRDCRIPWPPAFGDEKCECCTVTVGDGVVSHGDFTDIQQAIDSIGPAGGLVCILRGNHFVSRTIVLRSRRNIIIRGMGPATKIIFDTPNEPTPQNAFDVIGCEDIRLETFFLASRRALALIRFAASRQCRVEDCTLVNLEVQEAGAAQPSGRAVELVERAAGIEVKRNIVLAAKGVVARGGRTQDLRFNDNHMLTVQIAVLLSQVTNLEILHNRLRGISQEDVKKLTGVGLSANTLDNFQQALNALLLAPSDAKDFQAAAIFITTGNNLKIRQNQIIAQVGLLCFLAIGLDFSENDLLTLAGLVLFHGILLRVDANAFLSLIVGILQAGILVQFAATHNLFLGMNGIILFSPRQQKTAFTGTFSSGLSGGGFTSAPGGVIGTTTTTGAAAAGDTDFFGLAWIVKIHHNTFLTVTNGILKTAAVLSADFSVSDNTFEFCRAFGVALVGLGGIPPAFQAVMNPRHLVQANSLSVTGTGVFSQTTDTEVTANSVFCRTVAVALAGPFSTIRGNTLANTAARGGEGHALGLILLAGRLLNIEIAGNRLLNSRGHGILIGGAASNLTVQNNLIQNTTRCAITSATAITRLDHVAVERNEIVNCALTLPVPWTRAVIALPGGDANRVNHNHIAGVTAAIDPNGAGGETSVIYCEDIRDVEVAHNRLERIFEAGVFDGAPFRAIRLLNVSGTARVDANTIRNSAGQALFSEAGDVILHVNDNQITGTGDPKIGLIFLRSTEGWTQFNDNQIREDGRVAGNACIQIRALRVTASDNMTESGRQTTLQVEAREAVVNANTVHNGDRALVVGAGRGIATSNLTTGHVFSGGLLVANNIP